MRVRVDRETVFGKHRPAPVKVPDKRRTAFRDDDTRTEPGQKNRNAPLKFQHHACRHGGLVIVEIAGGKSAIER